MSVCLRLVLLSCLVPAACREAPPLSTPSKPDAAAPAAPAAEQVTLLFSASSAGQLVPCGCSPDQRGGLPRAVALVKKLRALDPNLVYLDAGDLLFESAARPSAQSLTQKELKARTLARGDELLGAAARVVGPRDLAVGPALLIATAGKVPLLDAGGPPLAEAQASLLVQAGKVTVGIFAAGLGEKPEETIAARAAELRKQGARLVVLIAQPRGDPAWAAAQALLPAAKVAGVDLVVLGHRDDPASDLDRKEAGPPPLLGVEGNGQSLLRVDVSLPAGAAGPMILARGAEDRGAELKSMDERIQNLREQLSRAPAARKQMLTDQVARLEARRAAAASQLDSAPAKAGAAAILATARFLPLSADLGEDAEAKALVDAYDSKVTELNLAEAKKQPESCPAPASGEASFVGVSKAEGCAQCHKTEVQFWEGTHHASAYATLQRVNKQFSLDCVRCHVTGWQQPGGICRIDKTAVGGLGVEGHGVGRQDVQCEMCHTAGSEHVEDPSDENIVLKVPASVCMRCHEAANSPHFDYQKYRPYITGPGHGAWLPKGERPHPFATGKGPNAP